jgi:PIN domain nuclease of toxin-antitoxin system
MRRVKIVQIDEALSIQAANISWQYKLPMADSIIYATAQQCQAVIWTTDQHFEHLPQVRYFDKKQSNIENRKP